MIFEGKKRYETKIKRAKMLFVGKLEKNDSQNIFLMKTNNSV